MFPPLPLPNSTVAVSPYMGYPTPAAAMPRRQKQFTPLQRAEAVLRAAPELQKTSHLVEIIAGRVDPQLCRPDMASTLRDVVRRTLAELRSLCVAAPAPNWQPSGRRRSFLAHNPLNSQRRGMSPEAAPA